MKEFRVEFVANDESFEAVQPADGAFDNPSTAVASKLTSVLGRWSNTIAAVRTDEIDAPIGQPLAERIAVGGLVVDELIGDVSCCRRIQKWFDKIYFGMIGSFDVDCQRQALPVREDHDLGSLAALGLTYAIAPFLAGENVPSAKPSCQSI